MSLRKPGLYQFLANKLLANKLQISWPWPFSYWPHVRLGLLALKPYRVIKITRYPSTRRVIKLPVPARTRLFITRIYPLLSKSLLV